VFRVVVVSRFIPGMRLPTYTACGFLGVDFRQFAIAAVLATLIWTSMLFALAMRVGDLFIAHLGVWRWAGAIGFALVIILAGRLLAGLHTEPAE
jgi:membrane protein DedA with SNARE-associated domain